MITRDDVFAIHSKVGNLFREARLVMLNVEAGSEQEPYAKSFYAAMLVAWDAVRSFKSEADKEYDDMLEEAIHEACEPLDGQLYGTDTVVSKEQVELHELDW